MKKTAALLLLIFTISLCLLTTYAENSKDNLSLDGKAAILIDMKSGQVLYEYNADTKLYPASTTKIMTAILALEMGDPDQIMTASLRAVYDIGDGGMNIGIVEGEQLPLEALLNAMLIKSANETANIIAENLCRTRQEFVDLMNAKAQELGAVNTYFKNPAGIHDDGHYTTARDLSLIARYAMSIPEFREIVKKQSYDMPSTNKHLKWNRLYTSNKLFSYTSEYYDFVTGIKTGYTSKAGYCLVSSAVNDEGMELISVILGGSSYDEVCLSSKKLLEFGFKNFGLTTVVEKNSVLQTVKVEGAKPSDTLELITSDSIEAVMPLDKSEWDLKVTEYINENIKAPIEKDQVLGYVEYESNGVVIGQTQLLASASVEKALTVKMYDTLKSFVRSPILLKTIKIILSVLIFFFILRTTLRFISRRINMRRRKFKMGRMTIKRRYH